MRRSLFTRVSIVLFLLLALTPPAPAQAANPPFTVDTTADTQDNNPGNGLCNDGTNHCSLRAAVMEANALAGDDEIILARNTTYTLNIVAALFLNDPTGSISIHPADGAGTNPVISGPADYHVFIILNSALYLNNLTVRDSHGIYVSGENSYLTMNGVTMSSNHGAHGTPGDSRYGGGAVHIESGNANLTSCVFINNTTLGNGGAIMNQSGKVGIYLSTFSGNSAVNGGGIYNHSILAFTPPTRSLLTIQSTTFEGNTASGKGGALYLTGYNQLEPAPQTTISYTRITGNHADYGGGLYIGKSTHFDFGGAYIHSSEISANSADSNGGALYLDTSNNIFDYGYTYLENNTISGNSANGSGGGIYLYDDFDNLVRGANLTITDNIADDDASGNGQGGGYFGNTGTKLYLDNSILAGNTDESPMITANDCQGDLHATYSLIGQVGMCSFDSSSVANLYSYSTPLDPLLGSLAYGGYSTQTHPILVGSPVIDMGKPSGCINPFNDLIEYDQRGEVRHSGWGCDMGAYESSFVGWRVFMPMIKR